MVARVAVIAPRTVARLVGPLTGLVTALVLVFFKTQILEHSKYKLQSETNRLRQIGDFNIYVPASHYGYVEMAHSVIAHFVTDTTVMRTVAPD